MTTPDHDVIRQLEDERFDAIVAGDIDTFVRLAHPDLTYVHSNAVTDSVESYAKKVRDGYYVYHRVDHPIDDIAIYGDVALVFGAMKADLTAGDVRKQLDNVSVAVWVRTSAGWRLRAYQPTVQPA